MPPSKTFFARRIISGTENVVTQKRNHHLNISRLVAALIPVFFALVLGYIAGKRHAFTSEHASGFSKLALGFALPATLFVSMTDIPRNLLLQQTGLVLALFIFISACFYWLWSFWDGILRSREPVCDLRADAFKFCCACIWNFSSAPPAGRYQRGNRVSARTVYRLCDSTIYHLPRNE
jgi:hypothetical protein